MLIISQTNYLPLRSLKIFRYAKDENPFKC